MPSARPITPQTLFAQGQFEALLALGRRDSDSQLEGDNGAYLAASLALTGRCGDAEDLIRAVKGDMSVEAQAFSWYHAQPAVLGAFRKIAPFYVYHAIARAYFAKGALGKALRAADRGSLHAARAFDPSHAKSLDAALRVHVHGMRGELALAMAAFERSAKTETLAVSRALYQARYGDSSDALDAARTDSPALKASLLLERARLQILCGKLDTAARTLETAAVTLEPLALPRFDRTYALRRIDLAIARGELSDCLIQLRAVDAALDPHFDAILALETLSRIVACLKVVGRPDDLARAAQRLAVLKEKTGYVVPAHPEPVRSTAAGFNMRQRAFIAELSPGVHADVHAYRKRFDVSEITACRDLAALVARGALARRGKARATRYGLP